MTGEKKIFEIMTNQVRKEKTAIIYLNKKVQYITFVEKKRPLSESPKRKGGRARDTRERVLTFFR